MHWTRRRFLALVAAGFPGDLEHRAVPAEERGFPAAPYLPRHLYQVVQAGLPPDRRRDGQVDRVAARAAADDRGPPVEADVGLGGTAAGEPIEKGHAARLPRDPPTPRRAIRERARAARRRET